LSSRRRRDRPWLTADGVRFSRDATRPRWRSLKITSNSASRLRSIRLRLIWFIISDKYYHWIHDDPTASLAPDDTIFIKETEMQDLSNPLAALSREGFVEQEFHADRIAADSAIVACQPSDVIAFWCEAGPSLWFAKDEAFDRRFRDT